jgi:hypothetical protein
MMNKTFVVLFAGLALALSAHTVKAEDADAETKEAAEEEAAHKKKEAELDRPIFQFIVGVLELKKDSDGKGVIGTLKAKGADYQVKLASPDLIKEYEKWDGKRVRLAGNPRNKGKYFVAINATAPPADK